MNHQNGQNAHLAERYHLAVLTLIWAAIIIIIHPVGEFPLNDDWTYALAVRSILSTGHFSLPSPSSANVIAQVYWGAIFCLPFGFSFLALRLSTLCLGLAGVLATYLLLRELGAERRAAFIGALTLACNPFYIDLSASFMTDVPFAALLTTSLWLYIRGVQRVHMISIALAILLAFIALFIRQFGCFLLLGFAAAHIARKGIGVRHITIAILPFFVGIIAQLFYNHWLKVTGQAALITVPSSPSNLIIKFAMSARQTVLAMLPYLGFAIAPLVIYFTFTEPPIASRKVAFGLSQRQLSAAFTILLFIGAVNANGILSHLGDILTTTGFGPLTLRDTLIFRSNLPVAPWWVMAFWYALTAFSLWVIVKAAPIFSRAGISVFKSAGPTPWIKALLLTIAITYIGSLCLLSVSLPIFDRYFLPLTPLCLALLVTAPREASSQSRLDLRIAPCMLLLTITAVFSIAATHDYIAWNSARWKATDSLIQLGISSKDIDGGYEFDGWTLKNPNAPLPNRYVITAGPLSGFHGIASSAVDHWLPMTTPYVYIMEQNSPPST